LDSVFAQTFQDFEIIVVNDGCPDTAALERVLERYPEKIRYLKQENAGVAAARNTAVLAASAPFIFTLDPDDWLQEDCLEFQVTYLCAHPEVDANYVNPVFRGGASDGSTWMDVYPSTGEVS